MSNYNELEDFGMTPEDIRQSYNNDPDNQGDILQKGITSLVDKGKKVIQGVKKVMPSAPPVQPDADIVAPSTDGMLAPPTGASMIAPTNPNSEQLAIESMGYPKGYQDPVVKPPREFTDGGGFLNRIRHSWDVGEVNTQRGLLLNRKKNGEQGLDEQIAALEAKVPNTYAEELESRSLPERALRGATEQIPIWKESYKRSIPTGIAAAIGTGTIAAASGVGTITAPVAAGMGYAVGSAYGTFNSIHDVETGLLYGEMLKKGVDNEIAKVASEAGGWIITGFEAVQLNTVVKAVPGLSKILRVGVKDVVEETVKKFTAKTITREAVTGFAKFEGQEVPTEVAQELTGFIAENTGKYLTNQLKNTGLPLDDINALVERLKQTAIQSAISFAPMGIVGHGSRAVINMTKTDTAQNWIDQNGQKVIDKITARDTLNSLNSWLQRSKDPNDTAYTGNDFQRWQAKQMGITEGIKMTPSTGTMTPEQIRSWDAQIGKEEIKTKLTPNQNTEITNENIDVLRKAAGTIDVNELDGVDRQREIALRDIIKSAENGIGTVKVIEDNGKILAAANYNVNEDGVLYMNRLYSAPNAKGAGAELRRQVLEENKDVAHTYKFTPATKGWADRQTVSGKYYNIRGEFSQDINKLLTGEPSNYGKLKNEPPGATVKELYPSDVKSGAVYREVVLPLLFTYDGLPTGYNLPNLGTTAEEAGAKAGENWSVQINNSGRREVSIISITPSGYIVREGSTTKRLPLDSLTFLNKTGEHNITKLRETPISKEEIAANPDTLYVSLSLEDVKSDLLGNNVAVINLSQEALVKSGMTKEDIAQINKIDNLYGHHWWMFAAIDASIARIKNLFTGVTPRIETYTWNINEKAFQNMLQWKTIDKKGGKIVRKAEAVAKIEQDLESAHFDVGKGKMVTNEDRILSAHGRPQQSFDFGGQLGEVAWDEMPDTVEIDSTVIKNSGVSMTPEGTPRPKATRRIVAGSREIVTYEQKPERVYNSGADVGDIVKITVQGREDTYWEVTEVKESPFKGNAKYKLKQAQGPDKPKKFTKIVIPEFLGKSRKINLEAINPDLYMYLYNRMNELNGFVDEINSWKEVPETVLYAGREVIVNSIHDFTKNGTPVYDTERGLITADGVIVHETSDYDLRPVQSLYIDPSIDAENSTAMMKTSATIERAKVGDIVSLEQFSEFKPLHKGEFDEKGQPKTGYVIKKGIPQHKYQKRAPVLVRITRKIENVMGALKFQLSEDGKYNNAQNKVLHDEMMRSLGKGKTGLGNYFKPSNKLGTFYPARTPHTYFEYELVAPAPEQVQSGDIRGFEGENRWLSNFMGGQVTLDGVKYPTVEHAYQAAKTVDKAEREMIRSQSTPGKAKRAGSKVTLRPEWNDIKVRVMKDLLKQKFNKPRNKAALAATTGLIEETNKWGDTFWGVSNGKGENNLGRLIMSIRDGGKVPPLPERPRRAKIGRVKFEEPTTLLGIMTEAQSEGSLADESEWIWRAQLKQTIYDLKTNSTRDPNVQGGKPHGTQMFLIWMHDLNEAVLKHNREKLKALVEQGANNFMDEGKILRMIDAIGEGLGVAPHMMSIMEWFSKNGTNISMYKEQARAGKFVSQDTYDQWGLSAGNPVKQTNHKFVLPVGKPWLNGEYTSALPFGEEDTKVEGYNEVWVTSPVLQQLYNEHLQSAYDALASGEIDALSDTAKRLFFEHPVLMHTEFARPYLRYLNKEINRIAKKELTGIEKRDALIKLAWEEGGKRAAEGLSKVEVQENVSLEQAENEQGQMTERETADELGVESTEQVAHGLGDTILGVFLDVLNSVGQKDFTKPDSWFNTGTDKFGNAMISVIGQETVGKLKEWWKKPGNKYDLRNLKNTDPGPLGIERQRFDTAMGYMRNSIQQLSALANAQGLNTHEYFKGILLQKGFDDDFAHEFATFFMSETYPRLVQGAFNKNWEKQLMDSSSSRTKGNTIGERTTSAVKDVLAKGLSVLDDIVNTALEIIGGTDTAGSTPNAKAGLMFYNKVPPEFRQWVREVYMALPRHIRTQLATFEHILFDNMSDVEKQLAVDFIAAKEEQERIAKNQPLLYKKAVEEFGYDFDNMSEDEIRQARINTQHWVGLKENEAFKRVKEMRAKIRERNIDSQLNIHDCVAKYKSLSSRNFDELVIRNKVKPEQKYDYHLHHQVLEYTEEWLIDKIFMMPTKIAKDPSRGYSEHRTWTDKEWQKATPQTMLATLMAPWVDNLIEDTVTDVLTRYDVGQAYIHENMSTDENGELVLSPELDKFINRNANGDIFTYGRGYGLPVMDAAEAGSQVQHKNQARLSCTWLKAGAEVTYGGVKHIAVPRTYYSTKYIHDELNGYKIVSGSQPTYLIPVSVDNTINNMTQRGFSWADKTLRVWNEAVKLFKKAAILGVYPVFQVNNMIGDVMMVTLLAENRVDILRNIGFSTRYNAKKFFEVTAPKWAKAYYTPRYNERETKIADWMDRHGIVDSTSLAEINIGHGKNPLVRLGNTLMQAGEARENWLRVAFAASLYDQMMDANPAQMEKFFKSYNWIPGIKDNNTDEAKLAHISRMLVTDYARQSETWKGFITHLAFPFGKWFFDNSYMLTRKGFKHPVSMTTMLCFPALFSAAWNLSDPDREKLEAQAPPGIRNKFHLWFWDKKTNSANIWAPQLPVDILPLVNLPGIAINNVIRHLRGEFDAKQAAYNFLKDSYDVTAEGFLRLANPAIRFFRGMINHQDPFDRAKIYPDDIKNMSNENINKYRTIFAMKCFVPVFGNYMNKYSMKFEPAGNAWFNTTKSWFDFKTMIGYKEDVPKSVGMMNPTIQTNYIGKLQNALGMQAQPSSTFLNYNLVTDVKDLDKTTRGLRFNVVEAFMRNAPSDPDSKKEIGKVFDQTYKSLQEQYPPEQLPAVIQLFMYRVGKRLESADVVGRIVAAEKEYWKDKDKDKAKNAQEMVDIARIRQYIDTLKGVGAEAKTQIPNILQNYSLGRPRDKNIIERDVEMIAPPSITTNNAVGNGGMLVPPSR